jgi:hypothetical protein
LPEADFFYELTGATALRIAEWKHLPQALLAAARVEEIEDDVAHLEGSSPHGSTVVVDLPRALLDRSSLTTGDVVWIFSWLVGNAALLDLLPALRVEVRRLDSLAGWLNAFVDVARSEDIGSDGLTDEERAEYAAQFSATIGADLTTEEIADLRAALAAGRVPRRRLRPAG